MNNKKYNPILKLSISLLILFIGVSINTIKTHAYTLSAYTEQARYDGIFFGHYGGALDGTISAKADGGKLYYHTHNGNNYWSSLNRYFDLGRYISINSSTSLTFGVTSKIISDYNQPIKYSTSVYVSSDNINWIPIDGTRTAPDYMGSATMTVDCSKYNLNNIRYFRESGNYDYGNNYTYTIDYFSFKLNITDTTAPTGTYSLSNYNLTNSDVTINVSATDNESGVKGIYLPNDGGYVSGSTANYTVGSNGYYVFKLQDNDGNIVDYPVSISNIDKSPPTATSAIIQNQYENGYDVYVYGVSDSQSGVNRVQFPTWTNLNDQDDIQPNWWDNSSATGTNLGNGTWMYHVNKANHNNEMGVYNTHVYIYDNMGNYNCVSTLQTTLTQNDDAVITSNDIPASMESGNTYAVHVTVKNTGCKTWDSNYRLGGINNSDPFANGRQYLPSGTTIAPGQSYTFTFNMVAPAIPNTYTTDWQMVHESVNWFGSTISKNVIVSDTIKPSINLTASTTNPTNGNVTIIATFSDTGSGIKNIKTPDNNYIVASNTNYIVTTNGTYTFVAYDNAGNATTQSITISNIDKTLPVITIGAYNTNHTNQNITVTASTNEGTLNTTSHTFTANGSFDFIAIDSAGNKTTKTITISNIDKTLPIITTAIDNYDKAKHSLTIGATTNKGTLNATSHTFTADGSFDFIATDSLGNTATKRETVTGLANGTPSVISTDITGGGSTSTASPITFTPSTTNPTNSNVNVTINFPSYEVTKQYKIGTSGNWTNYTGAITLSANDTIYAKATDSNGVINQNIFVVNNIDKIAPIITIGSYNTSLTNSDVIVTVTTNEGTLNATSHTFTANGSYDFIATDSAGNKTTKTVSITNIDKTAPILTLTQNITNPTNGNVTINANTTDSESGVKQIKLPDGTYITGSTTNYTVSTNGTYSFVVYDNAGNITTKSITVSNIDKIAPTLTLTPSTTNWTNGNIIITINSSDTGGSGVKQIKLPDGTYVTGSTTNYTVSVNGTYSFVVYDNAGNSTSQSISINNIDTDFPTLNLTQSTT